MPPLQFSCTLCQKTYARANELATHENSYDHLHKKRLKEMRAMTTHRPTAKVATEKAERRRREQMDVLGGNLVKPSETPRRKGVVREERKVEMPEEEIEVLDGLPWDRLGELKDGELGDMDGDVGRMMQGREGWRGLREDKSWVEEMWRGISSGRAEERAESPGSPQALGLGA